MDDLSWLAPTLLALGSLVAAIVSAWKSGENGKAIATVKEDTAIVKADTARVVEHTNGTLSAANQAKEVAENAGKVMVERIDGLERALAALKLSGALAAHASDQAAADVQAALSANPPEREEGL